MALEMLSKSSIENIICKALEKGDFAEVFCENNAQSLITADTGKVGTSSIGLEAGIGVRIFRGLDEIYVYSNGHLEEDIMKVLNDTVMDHINCEDKKGFCPDVGERSPRIERSASMDYRGVQSISEVPTDVSYKRKMEVINKALTEGKGFSDEINQVFVRYTDMCQDVIIANSDGVYAQDRRVKTRMMIIAYASGRGGIATGWQGPGAMRGFEFFEDLDISGYAREAARIAVAMANAEKCRGGRMPVIVANGFGGLIFHEACGHSLEASSVSKEMSEFSGKLGQQIASPLVTLIDDGSIKNAWGSLSVDDEGTPTRKNVLIEKGILKSYLVDRLNGKRMNAPITGSARRQNYRFAPTSRMTNTYIDGGETPADDIIAATERGLYVRYINGGSVNSATGDFNFASSESYLIENGRITVPLSGATLIGNGEQVLKSVDMVGNDPLIGEGFCYADSGTLFVGAGQPCIRVSEMTVGGVQ